MSKYLLRPFFQIFVKKILKREASGLCLRIKKNLSYGVDKNFQILKQGYYSSLILFFAVSSALSMPPGSFPPALAK